MLRKANHIVADARRKTDKIIGDLHKMARVGAAIKENKLMDARVH